MKKSTFVTVFLLAVLVFGVLPAPSSAAAAANCTDKAQFVADVTVPDGKSFSAGATFDKTWRLKNVGTCTWDTSYKLTYVDGTQMGPNTSAALPKSVAPGATVDATVNLTAPTAAGKYRGNWQLKNASGVLFGIGAAANRSFWVEIRVGGSDGGGSTGYDFVAKAPEAAWASGAGNLTFNGTDGDAKGFVRKLDTPKLENGTVDSAPGLLMVPQNITDGFIQGIFPAYTVRSGDRFQSTINCEYGASSCWVNFQLQYQIGSGAPIVLWRFNERYEGMLYRLNLDLSSLVGKEVKFILRNNAVGSAAGDRALWGSPRIANGITPPPITPTVTGTPPTPTVTRTPSPQPSSCDRALFVADVNVPDGTSFGPNTNFKKTWKIKNIGTCTWTTNYSLVFVSGEKLNGPDSVKFTSTINPNTTVEFSVDLTSPAANGTYRGYWMFKNDKGQTFGIGSAGNKPFWVEIKVKDGVTPVPTTPVGPSITPISQNTNFDFVEYAFSAGTWSSGAGVLTIPGTDGDAKGYVARIDGIKMETGNTDNRPALLMLPQSVSNGYVQGVYLPVKVQNGDKFQATIGCQQGATSCYVTYRLDYQIGNGAVKTLWAFNERYEGMVYNVNLDLSALAGQDVKFILKVLAGASANGDRAVWINPRITRAGSVTQATATVTPTVTVTVAPQTTVTPTVTPTVTLTVTPTITATPQ